MSRFSPSTSPLKSTPVPTAPDDSTPRRRSAALGDTKSPTRSPSSPSRKAAASNRNTDVSPRQPATKKKAGTAKKKSPPAAPPSSSSSSDDSVSSSSSDPPVGGQSSSSSSDEELFNSPPLQVGTKRTKKLSAGSAKQVTTASYPAAAAAAAAAAATTTAASHTIYPPYGTHSTQPHYESYINYPPYPSYTTKTDAARAPTSNLPITSKTTSTAAAAAPPVKSSRAARRAKAVMAAVKRYVHKMLALGAGTVLSVILLLVLHLASDVDDPCRPEFSLFVFFSAFFLVVFVGFSACCGVDAKDGSYVTSVRDTWVVSRTSRFLSVVTVFFVVMSFATLIAWQVGDCSLLVVLLTAIGNLVVICLYPTDYFGDEGEVREHSKEVDQGKLAAVVRPHDGGGGEELHGVV